MQHRKFQMLNLNVPAECSFKGMDLKKHRYAQTGVRAYLNIERCYHKSKYGKEVLIVNLPKQAKAEVE